MVSKGAATRERILEHALRMGSQSGLEGLTVAGLASELGLSKSGLFAHFGSKDALQVQVLEAATARFRDTVVRPALKAPRGKPRVVALFERWLSWGNDPAMPGGCIFITAAVELDDRPGPQRDFLVASQREWLATLAKAARLAVEVGHFRADLDAEQLAFELYALILGYNHQKRLLRDAKADLRIRKAFERLVDAASA
ncbi:MAG: TetR/AcrR family transcriptional regulator [Byssovorax sp.]